MSGKKKKSPEVDKNRRLDLFLTQLEIEEEKRKRIVNYVEDITFQTIKQRSEPKLRLKKD